MIHRRRLLAGAAPLLLAAPARAQGARTIRLIAGFPAGGLADVVARLVAGPLGDALGASVVVENRTGASGTIAADAVAKSVPDGTTLAVSHAIPFGFAPGVLPSLTYDAVADFTHLGMLAEAPTVMVVTARSPFATLPELLAAARTRPVRFGSSGVGSAEHFLGAVIGREAGATNLDHVPYRGTPPALQDLLAGQVEAINAPITTLVGQLRDGSLRALVVSTERRVPAFPDVPTVGELGFARATMTQWIGLSAPRRVAAAEAGRIVAAIPGILGRPEVAGRLEELASPPRAPLLVGEAFQGFVGAFRDHWVGVAREQGTVAG
jgi:tripartite-type tricarboxylate transporter receptor subunit TctC